MESRVESIVARLRALRSEEREAAVGRFCGGDAELEAAVRKRLAVRGDGAETPTSVGGELEGKPDPSELFVGAASGPIDRGRAAEADGRSEGPATGSEDLTSGEAGSVSAGGSFGSWPTLQPVELERPGDEIDRYKLLEQLGEGGFGIVWLAEQRTPIRRRVALKLIKPGMDSGSVLARFEAERQALALMDHPNVAKVLDGGATASGRPYFVMEHVPGLPITKFCQQKKLGLDERLRLFAKVCEAVSHAHQKGVIHRDIKPSNILVREVEGGLPEPKVIDFGVAKAVNASLTEKTLYTQHGQLVGTPAYMPPEQAGRDTFEVDTRADIYSLGVVLYELLTGEPPFDPKTLRDAGYEEMIRIVREVEPQRPSARLSTLGTKSGSATHGERAQAGAAEARMRLLSRRVRGDLDWVVMRCLEKDRNRRYAAVAELGAEVSRYLRNDPVEAGPPTLGYRAKKFARRHRPAVAAAAAALAFLVVYAGTATALTLEANRQQGIAEAALEREQRARAEAEAINAFLHEDLLRSADYAADGPGVRVIDVLARGAEKLESRFADQPMVKARLMASIGMTYVEVGGNLEAERLLIGAIEALTPHRAGDAELDAYVAELQRAYAETLWRTERAEEAIAYLEAATVNGEATAGGAAAEVDAFHQLALAMRYAGRLDAAEQVFADVVESRRELLGEHHEDTLVARYNLILLDVERAKRVREQDPEAFRAGVERAIERLRPLSRESVRHLGADHFASINIAAEVANQLNRLDRLDGARVEYERLLPAMRERLGDRHFRTLEALANWGRLEQKAGRHGDSVVLLREAHAGFRETRGLTAGYTQTVAGWLADALIETGQGEEAATLLERSYWDLADRDPSSDRARAYAGRLAPLWSRLGDDDRADRWRARADAGE